MIYRLATKDLGENSAYAVGKNLDIYFKESSEVCSFVRNKGVGIAKRMLGSVIVGKMAVPFKKYNDDLAHKPGISSGRYPMKCAGEILKIIKSAESNALNKGLNTNDLVITHICAHKASTPYHSGRQRRRKMKRSHIEVVVKEQKVEKKEKTTKNNPTKKSISREDKK